MPTLTPEQVEETVKVLVDCLKYLDALGLSEVGTHVSLGLDRFREAYLPRLEA